MMLSLFYAFIPTVSAATETTIKAYDGIPVKPKRINSDNYLSFGLTDEGLSAYRDWYAITNAAELYGFAELVNNGDKTAKAVLLNDIIVNKNVTSGSGAYSWTPIGNSKNSYKGTIDGAGHSISGLYFNDRTQTSVGLFGYIGYSFSSSKVEIKNVILKNSYFRALKNIGGIAGTFYGYDGIIKNCKVDKDVIIDLYDDYNLPSDIT